MNYMEAFCEALENGNGYDYMCDHYNDFSKFELADIVKEFIFNVPRTDSENYVFTDVVDSLRDYYC